ncbi:hypothetical protein [Nocardia takedensis]|uniref:hypothetical protein n=1 Tax=Nocardia takedensis TaxID=259390 RepID=UPI00031C1A0C|nr:hypothetical protein [Nocardia takedensis]
MPNRPPLDDAHGAGWLRPEPTLQPVPPAADPARDTTTDRAPKGHRAQQPEQPAVRPSTEFPARRQAGQRAVWIALAVALTLAAGLAGVGIRSVTDASDTTVVIAPPITASSITAGVSATTAVAGGACAGLTGAAVTDGPGETRSGVGVIAAFEYRYYVLRDAAAALAVVAPEAGLVEPVLAEGIASIPAGTRHCVAVTPLDDFAAEVHLVERHGDGTRMDYLQLINTRPTPNGDFQILNIQKRS